MPDAPLPKVQAYPGGRARAIDHLRQGRRVFERFFGRAPDGCWPSEGSVSDAAMALVEEEGFRWVASGESVLRNSLAHAGDAIPAAHAAQPLVRPYTVGDGSLACFFRDDGLSDLIGFTYADWHADDAVANLVHHLENIESASRDQGGGRVVSIILDGENAWEYYPENGWYFLGALYSRLADHERLRLGTFAEVLDEGAVTPGRLPGLVAGSWVYGTFSTWVGEPAKNRGWEMLVDAKRAYDATIASGRLDAEQQARAERQLAWCEGSDWFWWFGDYNPAETVSDFEHLFRLHLSNLYQILGAEPPEYLSRVFTRGQGAPARGGVMRKGRQDQN
jgi:alpha-amylase/alpha-mannosidase (GH57 family)